MNCDTPLLTVLVNTYQHAAYIAECLDGILSQHVDFKLHVLVIDDASTDGNTDIITKYARQYPDIIEPVLLKHNMFNTGRKAHDVALPRLKGKYIAICEGDDYWTYPDKLQRQVSFLETHPDYSGCFHLHSVRNDSDLPAPHPPRMIRDRDATAEDLILEHLAHTNSLVFRRTVFEDQKYWELYPLMFPITDILIFATMHSLGKVRGFTGRWSVYRIHNTGIFSSERIRKESTTTGLYHEQKLIENFFGKSHPLMKSLKLHRKLDQWSIKRIHGDITGAILQLLSTFAYNPYSFLRLYFKRYLL